MRAKRKIRDAASATPEYLTSRVDALLTVVYLIFNEGYLSRGSATGARIDLVEEAIRLTITARELLPGNAEVEGLLALELYARARHDTRFRGDELVLLEHQDRTRWDGRQPSSKRTVSYAVRSPDCGRGRSRPKRSLRATMPPRALPPIPTGRPSHPPMPCCWP